jgi:hypothetical protein
LKFFNCFQRHLTDLKNNSKNNCQNHEILPIPTSSFFFSISHPLHHAIGNIIKYLPLLAFSLLPSFFYYRHFSQSSLCLFVCIRSPPALEHEQQQLQPVPFIRPFSHAKKNLFLTRNYGIFTSIPAACCCQRINSFSPLGCMPQQHFFSGANTFTWL